VRPNDPRKERAYVARRVAYLTRREMSAAACLWRRITAAVGAPQEAPIGWFIVPSGAVPSERWRQYRGRSCRRSQVDKEGLPSLSRDYTRIAIACKSPLTREPVNAGRRRKERYWAARAVALRVSEAPQELVHATTDGE